ncbi:hypothetical protein OUZ56_005400 [Daphnia magna]|uniref:Uncharacterized protein n=1 Tax=Daphnia magna TaxID=35525 RepID=A0ABQ9YSP6_9CRUS|nr:hypothetical protein OUZ56_005400 [Daphnia magna]
MGLFVTGCDCKTTGAIGLLSIPAASSSMTLVTFTGIICRKLACRTHSSEVTEHNRGIFMTPAAGSTCGMRIPPIFFPGHWSTMVTVPLDSFLLPQKDSRCAALHPSFSVTQLQKWALTAHVWSAFPDFVHVELDEQPPIWRYPQVLSQSRVRMGYRLLFAGGYRHRKHTISRKVGPVVIEDLPQLRLLSPHLTRRRRHESTDFGFILRQLPHESPDSGEGVPPLDLSCQMIRASSALILGPLY